uniref:Ig-like domain-containing protein n=1 Tax=Xenopus tropicalis TaxID=8364 RepID=A0A6I8S405_XENTR
WRWIFTAPLAPSLTGSAQQVRVTQAPGFLLAKAGSSATLNCSHTGPSYYSMLWYQQNPGLKLMVLSSDTKPGNMEEGFTDWTMERPGAQSASLSLSNAGAEHSAVYFCAVSDHSH